MRLGIIGSITTQVQQLFHVKHGHQPRLFESSNDPVIHQDENVPAFLSADGNQEQEETSYSYRPRAKVGGEMHVHGATVTGGVHSRPYSARMCAVGSAASP